MIKFYKYCIQYFQLIKKQKIEQEQISTIFYQKSKCFKGKNCYEETGIIVPDYKSDIYSCECSKCSEIVGYSLVNTGSRTFALGYRVIDRAVGYWVKEYN